MELSELLIVIFGIPGLLAAGCVSGVLLLGQDPTILVTGVTGVCIAIRDLMVDTDWGLLMMLLQQIAIIRAFTFYNLSRILVLTSNLTDNCDNRVFERNILRKK